VCTINIPPVRTPARDIDAASLERVTGGASMDECGDIW
jgi:hypothetical protein